MATNTIKTRIQHKHGTATSWESNSSFVPLAGELIIYDTTPPQVKIGNGETSVGSLPFIKARSDVVVSPSLTSGTKVGTITVDGVSTVLYCQTNTNTTYSAGTGLSLSGTTFSLDVSGAKTALGLGSAAYTASTAYAPFSHYHDYIYGTYTHNGGQQPPSYVGTHALKCNMMNGFVGSSYSIAGYMDTLLMNAYSWSDVPYATALGILKTNSTTPRAWIACGPNGDSWTGVAELLTDKNYTSYVPTKTGSGASGTWGINITGNAATASKLQTARTISLTGSVTGSGSFDGSGNLNIATTTNHTHSYLPLSSGTLTGLLIISTNSRSVALGCQNQSYAHYSTNADSGHWFNTDVRVQGNIYCGSNYNKKVISEDGGYLNNQLISHSVNGGMWISGTHSAAFVVDTASSASAGSYYQGWYSGKTQLGAWSLGCLSGDESMYFVYGSDANFNTDTNTTAHCRMASSGAFYGAVWNDYAEYRQANSTTAGRVVHETVSGIMELANERLLPACEIISDTFGFAIGETDKCKTPIACTGRVLAYTDKERDTFNIGDAVCSGVNGTVSVMTREEIREYPDRIIGYVSEIPQYEVWGTGNVKVNGRIWIRIR